MTAQVLAAKPPENYYSEKYKDLKLEATYYELKAIFKLRNMGLYDCDYTAGWHWTPQGQRFNGPHVTGAGDRFDLYSPFKGLWFEVSATKFTFEQSKSRYGIAKLAVLPDKIDHAVKFGILNRLIFVSLNHKEGLNGEIRFMPAVHVPQYSKGQFAANEGDYYLTDWCNWWDDLWLRSVLDLDNAEQKLEGP